MLCVIIFGIFNKKQEIKKLWWFRERERETKSKRVLRMSVCVLGREAGRECVCVWVSAPKMLCAKDSKKVKKRD